MRKLFTKLFIIATAACSLAKAGFDHTLLDQVLQQHVARGLVDYAALSKDKRLDDYLALLATADTNALESRNEQLAFYINAYNAYTLKLVASAHPVDSIRLIKGLGETAQSIEDAKPWSVRFATIGGKAYTLDEIEHEILRKEYKEPRIHFAIVCAAISCPLLRNEAYVAERLEEQFEAQGRWFYSWRNQFDLQKKEARLSKILEWFSSDFGKTPEEVLRFAIPYVNQDIATSLKKDAKNWKVTYQTYSWKLNEQ